MLQEGRAVGVLRIGRHVALGNAHIYLLNEVMRNCSTIAESWCTYGFKSLFVTALLVRAD